MSVLFPDAIDRPTCKTPAVREKALRGILPDFVEWLKEDCEDEASILKDLGDVLNGWNDGYQAARDLEHIGWSPDSELVEILDSFSEYRARDEAVKAWVKEVQPKPAFKLGDRVIWKRQIKSVQGTITKIYSETAQYIVSESGDAPGCGTYVNWEDAEAMP